MKDEAVSVQKGYSLQKVLIIACKFAITGACFWYVFRQIEVSDFVRTASNLDFRWMFLCTIMMMLQIPLVGVRWTKVMTALVPQGPPVQFGQMIAISAISIFFAQVMPNVVSDGIRTWLLSKIGTHWRKALASVLIDRGVGVGALVAVGFATLLFPSALSALGGYRLELLFVFGGILAGAAGCLLLAPFYAPMLIRLPATKWIGELVAASHRVLIESPAALPILAIAFGVHVLSIAGIWMLGRAFAMTLPVVDASVLFTLMVAIAILPISVGGWGLRELAVTAFLNAQGIASGQALLFSICFGLTLIAASIPGAIVLIFYSPRKAQTNLELTR